MGLKICPDGQNKGFGWRSGKERGIKKREGERKVVVVEGGREKNTKMELKQRAETEREGKCTNVGIKI